MGDVFNPIGVTTAKASPSPTKASSSTDNNAKGWACEANNSCGSVFSPSVIATVVIMGIIALMAIFGMILWVRMRTKRDVDVGQAQKTRRERYLNRKRRGSKKPSGRSNSVKEGIASLSLSRVQKSIAPLLGGKVTEEPQQAWNGTHSENIASGSGRIPSPTGQPPIRQQNSQPNISFQQEQIRNNSVTSDVQKPLPSNPPKAGSSSITANGQPIGFYTPQVQNAPPPIHKTPSTHSMPLLSQNTPPSSAPMPHPTSQPGSNVNQPLPIIPMNQQGQPMQNLNVQQPPQGVPYQGPPQQVFVPQQQTQFPPQYPPQQMQTLQPMQFPPKQYQPPNFTYQQGPPPQPSFQQMNMGQPIHMQYGPPPNQQ
ncbi:hypothetical protein HK098_007243 [Nowakowskiella sp. JEL0407]|nr:hypothetical protein HK098_007243 [Nowakowskiella sp. JEL0407]